ncbi:MAG: DUF7133 domain-containing protein, partial [Planctomycetia bacterium]
MPAPPRLVDRSGACSTIAAALFLAVAFSAMAQRGARAADVGWAAPDGFAVSEFAGNDLATDVYTLTFDPAGRPLVSSRSSIRRLLDDDADGKADRFQTVADEPADGAMGLFAEGDDLYFTGAGGLRRLRDADRDGSADGPSQLLFPLKTGGEHSAHAVRRGPDGWLYVLCGNASGPFAGSAAVPLAPTSPLRNPIAGVLLRLAPDFASFEIVADGFRNPYDFDFDAAGEPFVFDSDNERCVSLPWYEGTRFYHAVPGGDAGWRSPERGETWRLPSYAFDVLEPLVDLGRGSPTGVVSAAATSFPPSHRAGFFLLDWTFGKVWLVKTTPHGSSYLGAAELFLQPTGDAGFAPTDAAVHPRTGDLWLSVGGRGTRGGVYVVRWTGKTSEPVPPAAARPAGFPPAERLTPLDDARRRQVLTAA